MGVQVVKGEQPTYQPARVIVGHCPECKNTVVIFNDYETWPLVRCKCGWSGATTDIDNHIRLEREGKLYNIAPILIFMERG